MDPRPAPPARPFTVGDRVHAGWKIVGCDTHWWEGTGPITDIWPAAEIDGETLPARARVAWDRPVLQPCTHDRWDSAPEELGSAVIPLTDDHTAAAHPTMKRIRLVG